VRQPFPGPFLAGLSGTKINAGVWRVGEGPASEAGERDAMAARLGPLTMMSDACRTTASVRASDEPGGNWKAAIR